MNVANKVRLLHHGGIHNEQLVTEQWIALPRSVRSFAFNLVTLIMIHVLPKTENTLFTFCAEIYGGEGWDVTFKAPYSQG